MMRDTPRAFVGTVAFHIERWTLVDVIESAGSGGWELVPGVQVVELDVSAGTLMITAERPTDRGDVVAALCRLGCTVRD
ncbi:MAG TPA: hypothetical protein VFP34_15970 [Microlunatus sp.]|nr:hypothetical protein [Microlunatus sp.]